MFIFCKCNCLFQYTFMNIWSSILVVTNCINKISCLVLKTVLVVLTYSNVSLESWDWKVYLWYEDGVQRWCPVICDSRQYHCVKSFQMRSFFSFEHRKIRSEKYSIFGHFSQSVLELSLQTTLWFIFQVLFWQNLSDVMDVACIYPDLFRVYVFQFQLDVRNLKKTLIFSLYKKSCILHFLMLQLSNCGLSKYF